MKKRNEYLDHCLATDSDKVRNGNGQNIIPPPEKQPLWKGFLEKFKDPIILVLLVVFCFSVGVSFYEIYHGKGLSLLFEPMGVLVALLLATGVGFVFEVKAEKEFDILNKVKDTRPVKVMRSDHAGEQPRMMEIKKCDVVVGDIIKLESGDEIPADGILVDVQSLRVDESNFTGEPYTTKYVEEEKDSNATYPTNFVLRDSTVIEGNAFYRVTAIGMDTEEGKGAAKVQEGSDVKTPLNAQLDQLGRMISNASFIVAGLIILGRLIYFFSFNSIYSIDFISFLEFLLDSIMIAVTLIVVAVPEGLPMSITVSLALSMRKMLKEKNLVRKLHACETMGAATVICTDKTGTLTQNQMTVVDTEFYGDTSSELIDESMAINSTAELSNDEKGNVQLIGNPTEGALLKWLMSRNVDYSKIRSSADIRSQKPFSTETKYMETVVGIDENSSRRYIKGAPEMVLQMCSRLAGDITRETVDKQLSLYQSKAMRTLGFAYQNINQGVAEPLTFIGVVGIADPIRDDVKEAIHTCRDDAGVRVIIVTGDTPGTANEIGRQIGLVGADEQPQTMTGPAFAALSDDEAQRIVSDKNFKIISRARPDDKARLVTLLQANKEVVAVTGDGTNDAPALSKAQVGLSMGDGTARAKEASDITIIDNSFSSINKAIMWGRSLYLNIRRFIVFQMTINVCACLIVLLGAFIGLDSPLTVTQMLWVNLIMDTFAAMALSSLPADKKVLKSKPRNPDSHIIDRKMMIRIFSFAIVFFVFLTGLWQLLWHSDVKSVTELLSVDRLSEFFSGFLDLTKLKSHLSTYELGIFFTTFVLIQFWNLFNARYFRTSRSLIRDIIDLFVNPKAVKSSFSLSFLLIALVIIVGQYLIVNYAGAMFNVSALSWADWGWLLLLTSPILWVPDIIRFIQSFNKAD